MMDRKDDKFNYAYFEFQFIPADWASFYFILVRLTNYAV